MQRLRLLGGASIETPAGPATGPAVQRRRLALLALLAADPAAALSRDRLTALLAPESDAGRGRHLVRDAVYALRAALGADAIVAAADELRLSRDRLSCDLWDFEAALDSGRLEDALALYAGPFLAGFHLPDAPEFEEWAEARRARLQARAAAAMETLAEARESAGDFGAAALWWDRRVADDPLSGRLVLRAMQALEASGDRAGALRRASMHARLLRDDLDARPDVVILELEERLRRGGSPPAPAEAGDDPGPPAPQRDGAPPESHAPGGEVGGGARTERLRFHRMPSPLRVAALGALVLAFGVIALLASLPRRQGPTAPRVAVLELQNLTGDSSLASLGAIASDWLTHALASTGVMEVVPLATVRAAAGDRLDSMGERASVVRTVAHRTGARALVEGSIYRQRDTLVFAVRVMNGATGTVLSTLDPVAVPVHLPMDGVHLLRERVLAALVPAMDPRTASFASLIGRPPSYDAYREYAAAMDLLIATEPARAIAHLERALTHDSSFYIARIFHAMAHWNLGHAERANALATRIDGEQPLLPPLERAILDNMLAWGRGDRAAAYAAATRAARLAPSSAQAVSQQAVEALRMGRAAEAATLLATLDPEHPELRGHLFFWDDRLVAYHALGDHVRELAIAVEGRERYPDHPQSLAWTVRALAALGRVDDLRSLLEQAGTREVAGGGIAGLTYGAALELRAHGFSAAAHELLNAAMEELAAPPPGGADEPERRRLLARVHIAAGRWSDALHTLAPLLAAAQRRADDAGLAGVALARSGAAASAAAWADSAAADAAPYQFGIGSYWRGAIAAGIGDDRAAMSSLRQAFAEGRPYSLGLHRDPEWDPLRGDRAFLRLIAPVR